MARVHEYCGNLPDIYQSIIGQRFLLLISKDFWIKNASRAKLGKLLCRFKSTIFVFFIHEACIHTLPSSCRLAAIQIFGHTIVWDHLHQNNITKMYICVFQVSGSIQKAWQLSGIILCCLPFLSFVQNFKSLASQESYFKTNRKILNINLHMLLETNKDFLKGGKFP